MNSRLPHGISASVRSQRSRTRACGTSVMSGALDRPISTSETGLRKQDGFGSGGADRTRVTQIRLFRVHYSRRTAEIGGVVCAAPFDATVRHVRRVLFLREDEDFAHLCPPLR